MAITPLPNVGGMLDRAVCAYLIANGVGTWQNTFPSDSLETRVFPNITVLSHSSEQSYTPSGDETFHTSITVKYSAAGTQQSANPYAARVARDALIGQVMYLMSLSDDGATGDYTAAQIQAAGQALATSGSAQEQANNADMANFSCLHLYFEGSSRGNSDEPGVAWVEARNFRIIAAPSALS